MLTAFPKVTVFVYEYLVSYFSATLVFNEILSVAVLVLSPESVSYTHLAPVSKDCSVFVKFKYPAVISISPITKITI